MHGMMIGLAGSLCAALWLVLLVASGFNVALAGAGALIVLCISGSTRTAH